MFTTWAHTSLPQRFGSFVKQMLPHTHVPKSNPAAISIYSPSIMRCFMLTRSIWYICATARRRNKGISKKHWPTVPSTRTCHVRQLLPKALPGLVFPETVVQECGLQDTREKKTHYYYAVYPACLNVLTSGGSWLTYDLSSYSAHHFVFSSSCKIVLKLSRSTSTAQGGIRNSKKPSLFSIPPGNFKILLPEKQKWAVRSRAPQQAGAVWNGFRWSTALLYWFHPTYSRWLDTLLYSPQYLGQSWTTVGTAQWMERNFFYWDKIHQVLRTIDHVDEISETLSQLLAFACSWIFPNNIPVTCKGLGRNILKLLLLNVTTSKHFDTGPRDP